METADLILAQLSRITREPALSRAYSRACKSIGNAFASLDGVETLSSSRVRSLLNGMHQSIERLLEEVLRLVREGSRTSILPSEALQEEISALVSGVLLLFEDERVVAKRIDVNAKLLKEVKSIEVDRNSTGYYGSKVPHRLFAMDPPLYVWALTRKNFARKAGQVTLQRIVENKTLNADSKREFIRHFLALSTSLKSEFVSRLARPTGAMNKSAGMRLPSAVVKPKKAIHFCELGKQCRVVRSKERRDEFTRFGRRKPAERTFYRWLRQARATKGRSWNPKQSCEILALSSYGREGE